MPLVRLLRILSTVLLGVAIGQAGFGSGLVGSVFAGAEDELLETLHLIKPTWC